MSITKYPLPGLDGSNPLAFLASLGTLRLFTLMHPNMNPRMEWDKTTRRPVLHLHGEITTENISQTLYSALIGGTQDNTAGHKAYDLFVACQKQRNEADKLSELKKQWLTHAAPHLNFGLDTKFKISEYRILEEKAASEAFSHRSHADMIASLCSSAVSDDEDLELAADTDFRTARGAGNQHFLKTMVKQLMELSPKHVHKTLFAPWLYDDPMEALSLRWDPLDDVRYALRWRKPSGDPIRKKQGNMIAANALAANALALHPVMPSQNGLVTTGFCRIERNICWTWPLWEGPIDLLSVKSLLALRELQQKNLHHERLAARGVFECFRTKRFTQGNFRNLTPAMAI